MDKEDIELKREQAESHVEDDHLKHEVELDSKEHIEQDREAEWDQRENREVRRENKETRHEIDEDKAKGINPATPVEPAAAAVPLSPGVPTDAAVDTSTADAVVPAGPDPTIGN